MSFWNALSGNRMSPAMEEALKAAKARYVRGGLEGLDEQPWLTGQQGADLEMRARYPQRMDMGRHPDEDAYLAGEEMSADLWGKLRDAPVPNDEDLMRYAMLEDKLAKAERAMDRFYGRGVGIGRAGLNAAVPLPVGMATGRGVYDQMLEHANRAAEERERGKGNQFLMDLLYAMDIPGNMVFDALAGATSRLPEWAPAPVYSTGSFRK